MYFVVTDDNGHIEIQSSVRHWVADLMSNKPENEEKALEISGIVLLSIAFKLHACVLGSNLNACRKKYGPFKRNNVDSEQGNLCHFYIYLPASRN